MPTFAYLARDSRGAQVEGTRDATDQNAALLALREAGFFVTRLTPVSSKNAAKTRPEKNASAPNSSAQTPLSNAAKNANVGAPHSNLRNAGANSQNGSTSVNENAAARGESSSSAGETVSNEYSKSASNVAKNAARNAEYSPTRDDIEARDQAVIQRAATAPISRRDAWIFANSKELSLFFRQMHAMINAGSSVTRSLQVYGEHAGHKGLRRATLAMQPETAQGRPLSAAMRAYPGLFTPLMVNMIAAGEQGGFLDTMCQRLAEYCENDHALQQNIKRETLYPKILLVCALFIPSVVTLVLSGFSVWLQQVIPLLIFLVFGLAIYRVLDRLTRVYGRDGNWRFLLDSAKLLMPVGGKVVRSLATAKFSRALAAMYAAGVGAETSMRIAGESCGNLAIERRVGAVASELNSGAGFTKTLAKMRQFPPIAMQMLATGEESGAIDTQLEKVAQFLEIEAETAIRQAVKILGVLLFLVVAAYIGSMIAKFYVGYGAEIEKYSN